VPARSVGRVGGVRRGANLGQWREVVTQHKAGGERIHCSVHLLDSSSFLLEFLIWLVLPYKHVKCLVLPFQRRDNAWFCLSRYVKWLILSFQACEALGSALESM
jgi:hypothetical protein